MSPGCDTATSPSEFPWIVPFYPTFVSQGRLFAKFILHERARAKIAVQYKNDDLGRDYLKGYPRYNLITGMADDAIETNQGAEQRAKSCRSRDGLNISPLHRLRAIRHGQ